MTKTAGTTLRDKLDRFWSVLFLNEHGRPKSAMFLYSFCLSLLFFALYAISYFFFIDWIELWLSGVSIPVRNLAQSILPGFAATIVCCAMFFLFPDRRLIPVSYIWLAAYALFILIIMACITSKDEFRIFLYFFAMIVPAGLISGGITSLLLFLCYNKQKMKDKAAC